MSTGDISTRTVEDYFIILFSLTLPCVSGSNLIYIYIIVNLYVYTHVVYIYIDILEKK